ncbi:ankyrin [Piromyces finnis]|uniref:Ankyrin n=1 Tax=Piromyces finnis TaxID=1754191 RepID=A0A1Y1VLU9_9FUNG|nr:ankyrin [Piromyces finnis]|eukprot:ORX59263.1 ankyrin [Piromyces finnis]
MVELLVNNYHINIYELDDNNNTVFHKICEKNDFNNKKLITYFKEKGVNINRVNKDGDSPLITLSKYTAISEAVPILLKNGADINIRNNNGETALLASCKYGYYDVSKMLIDCGADVNIPDNEGNTPLLVSCYKERFLHNKDLVEYLIEHGADINKANKNGRIPFHEIVYYANNCLINYFIDHEADINKMDNNGINSLKIARSINNEDCIKNLISHGAK